MMTSVIAFLALIGGIVVAIFLYQLGAEVVRALRQGRRIAAAGARCVGRREVRARHWLTAAYRDFLSSYTSLHIGVWVLPHDPKKPIRRQYHWSRY